VFGAEVFRLTNIEFIHRIRQVLYIKQMLDKNINSPVTSSMGRLFDGVSAILGIRSTASFEAQAAMELEFAASDVNTSDHFKFKVEHAQGSGYVINWHVMLRELVTELNAGVHSDILSAKFHNTLSEIIIETAKLCGIEKVVLTGGCFQNRYLLEKSIQRLREEKFKVYWHQRVPTNDGGISLGQIKYSSFR
jgi:hydrogenase maturation protein HypF